MPSVHERARLAALRDLDVVDTPPDPRFDDITRLAADLCHTPMALITFIDDSRQWFKSRVGVPLTATAREHAFCEYALAGPELLEVEDAARDERFASNPLVTGEPRVRFYAGAPLVTTDGHVLGTLCVLDRVPRVLDDPQRGALRVLSRLVMTEMELRRVTRAQERVYTQLDAEQKILRLNRVYALMSGINDAIVHVRDRDLLFARVCDIAVRRGGLKAAWIGLVHAGETRVRKVAQAGDIAPYLEQQYITWSDDEQGRGPTGTAIRTGMSSVCNDIAREPAFRPWREPALAHGYRASASFPLMHDGIAFGALSLYADAPGYFDATETGLLEELAANIAYAVYAIEEGERRQEAQRQREHLELQLLRAQRLESIGTLAGGIAHDLNNVLTPIIFSIEMLREGTHDPDTVPLLDEIDRSARRGADMVRQLLLFARGGTGQHRPTDVGRVLTELVHTLRETMPRHIEVQADIAPDLEWVNGDPTQLHQVVLNLCVNARDAMPHPGVLRVVAYGAPAPAPTGGGADARSTGPADTGNTIVVEVHDSGVGMTDEVVPRIFDPFFTTKAPGEGTGLGLPTSRNIVAAHGGDMEVTSRPGFGTTFRVRLPAIARGSTDGTTAGQPHMPRGAGESILFVDDEAPIRAVAATVLSSFGYRVTVAVNGADALTLFRAAPQRYDIIVTDLMMPVMDGVSFIAEATALRPGVPVIVTSGVHDEAHRATVESGTISEFLAKPYATETILSTIRRVLSATGRVAGAEPAD